MDGHRRLSVCITGRRQEQNLGGHTDVEFHRIRARQVVLWIVCIAVAHRINPFSSTTELDRNLMGSSRCVFGEGVREGVATGLVVGLDARHRYTVDQEVNNSGGGLSIFLQHHVEIVEECSVHNKRVACDKNRWCFRDDDLRLAEHDELRRRVGSDDAGGSRHACIIGVNVGGSHRHV